MNSKVVGMSGQSSPFAGLGGMKLEEALASACARYWKNRNATMGAMGVLTNGGE